MLRSLTLPLHAAPLLLVAIFAVLLRLASHAGFLGLPLALVLGSWFFKYGFMLLDHAAQGRPDAPVLTTEAANPVGEMRPLLYFIAIATFYALTALVGDVSNPGITDALRVVGLLALPAVIATHAITGSFLSALNPATIVEMVRRLGPGYLWVIAVSAGCAVVGKWVAVEAGSIPPLLRIALLMLLWLTLFSTLGTVIYERRFEVGFEPEHSPEKHRERTDRERDRERDRFVDQLFAEYRSGSRANAMESIEKRVAQSPSAVDEYAWILVRVGVWPNPKLANQVALKLLPLLLAAQRNGDALTVIRDRIAADPDFRPSSTEQLIRLAQLARDGGDRTTARALLKDFEQRYPGDPARNSARQLAAQLER